MIKRITVIAISFILLLSSVICIGGCNDEGAINVWTAFSTEKILQQQNYNDRYDSKELNIAAFRNEREAGQIILSANKEDKSNVDSYELTVNDLTDGSGNVLSATNWQIFNQKYTFVPAIYENSLSGLPIGWYPDALLPMDTAVDYGENIVSWDLMQAANAQKAYQPLEETNLNQGIWLEVKIPKDAVTGVYTGTFILDVDGEDYEIPVTLEVYGYTLGDYTHTKSSFGLEGSEIAKAELDSSEEMWYTYADFLLDHRINPQGLPSGGDELQYDVTASEERMEKFLTQAVTAATDDRVTSFNIPYTTAKVRYYYYLDEDSKPLQIFTVTENANGDEVVDFKVNELEGDYFYKLIPSSVDIKEYVDGSQDHLKQDLYIKSGNGYQKTTDSAVINDSKVNKYVKIEEVATRNPDGTERDINRTLTDAEKNYIQEANWQNETVVDFDNYVTVLKALAQRALKESMDNIDDASVTKPVDVMKKVATYFMMYDEFNQGDEFVFMYAAYCQEKAYWVNQDVAEELLSELTLTSQEQQAFESKYGISFESYRNSVAKECSEIRNKIVGTYDEYMLASHGVYVPQIRFLNDPSQRQDYYDYESNGYGEGVESELWTYICNHPNTPYTTLQVDDYLISARMYGWFMYEANVVGHLEWQAGYYTQGVLLSNGWQVRQSIQMDQYYEAAGWPNSNGEGKILYPGREYGIKGPIASIRLKALSDGIEDYDLLYELEEKYKERNVSGDSFDNVYKLIYGNLRNGMQVNYNDNLLTDFNKARELLAGLLVNAYDYGVVLENYEVNGDKGVVTISAPADLTITCNGNACVSSTTQADVNGNAFTRYTFEIELTGSSNSLTIAVKSGGNNLSELTLNAGSKATIVSGDWLAEKIFSRADNTLDEQVLTLSVDTLVPSADNGVEVEEKVTTLTFAAKEKGHHTAFVDASSLNINVKTESVKVYVYYDGSKNYDITWEVLYNKKSNSTLIPVTDTVLKKGWNELTIYGASLSFIDDNDAVKQLAYSFYTYGEVSLSVGSIVIGG